jgi:predicted O-linked N-acetylglucosamine transferase (SPINDLY family)
MKSLDRFIDVRMEGHAKVAELLRDMEIDIAIDLMGFVNGSQTSISAWRSAPIQVNYLGYPGTMGGAEFDYIIADETIIPTEQRAFYSEKVVWLPDCYQPNDRQRVIAEQTFTRS